jgi:hypothetical protein
MELLISFSLLANLIVISNAEAGNTDPVLRLPFFQSKELKACTTKKSFQYLSKDIKKDIASKVGMKTVEGFYPVYKSDCSGKNRYTYILNDVVRSEYQTLLISLIDQELDHIEVVRFDEPDKYKAPTPWYQLFKKFKKWDDIDAISGATLTRSSTLKLAKLAKELGKYQNEKK